MASHTPNTVTGLPLTRGRSVHHLVPRAHEVAHELLLSIVASVYIRKGRSSEFEPEPRSTAV